MNSTGFFDAFQRITDTAVSVIGAVKGNKAAERAAEQQVASQQQNTNLVKYVVWGVLAVASLGLIIFIFKKK